MTRRSPVRQVRTAPGTIRLAMTLCLRVPPSLRTVEDLPHERGIGVSHEAVRFWWMGCGPMCASGIRGRRAGQMRSSRWSWHLDGAFVKVNGVQHSLWRAVDREGEVRLERKDA